MTRKDNTTKAGAAAPAKSAAGDNVKVDIETEETPDVEAPEAEIVEPDVVDADDVVIDDDDEQARIDAAIAAGEAAAEADFKADVDTLRAERDDLARKLSEVDDRIQEAEAKSAEAADKLVRLQADWANYRRRVDQERVVERERACENMIKDLLPAIDDLERAIAHAQSSAEGNDAVAQLADGVSAVHAKIIAALEKQGAEIIDPADEAFDPQDHQAVGRVENPDAYEDSVADVYQKGYRLGGKLVRPAMVTVTYGGPKRPVASGEAPEDAQEGAER